MIVDSLRVFFFVRHMRNIHEMNIYEIKCNLMQSDLRRIDLVEGYRENSMQLDMLRMYSHMNKH